tara:strand:- start:469 stop:708 length:240 start_codon:yes stop_codon:yes gene_type:complete
MEYKFNRNMDEALDIVYDWADDYGLNLMEDAWNDDFVSWEITSGNPRLRGIKDLQEQLYSINYDLGFDEPSFVLTIFPF